MNNDICMFCEEGSRMIEIKKNGVRVNRKLYETDNFYITVSVGAIVEGHILVIPKEHYLSMGELPNDLLDELKMIYHDLKSSMGKYYGKRIMAFEHGTGRNTDVSAASVIHAHLHILPVDDSLMDEIQKYDCNIIELNDISDLCLYADKGRSYLFYADTNQKIYSLESESLPSQFFRKLVAEKFNLGEWNWRKDYKEFNVCKTVEAFADWGQKFLGKSNVYGA